VEGSVRETNATISRNCHPLSKNLTFKELSNTYNHKTRPPIMTGNYA
jgi:hypothetical protein